MIRKENKGYIWFEFEIFQPYKELKHGVFPSFYINQNQQIDSLDLSSINPNFQKNIQHLSKAFEVQTFHSLKQVHEDKIIIVKDLNHQVESGDGLITTKPSQALLIRHADCQATLFYDPIKQVIANVHCGWKGSCLNIYKKTIKRLKLEFQCNPKDLLVAISPSLGPKNAEFLNYQKELPNSFLPFKKKKNHFNFWEISKWQLKNCGILEQNIEVAHICTYEQSNLFFSYRKNRTLERNGSFISLNLAS